MHQHLLRAAGFALLALILSGCGDGSDRPVPPIEQIEPEPEPIPESQLLRERFSAGREFISQEGMQGLLDFADGSSPVLLFQLINVTDEEGFAAYEVRAEELWQSVGGGTRLASSVFARMSGERDLVQARVLEFPNISMLLDAMRNDLFPALMDELFAASDDHAWVLGVEEMLPFEPGGSYVDPALQGLDREEVTRFLESRGDQGVDQVPEAVIDMLVSDDPSPFFMVNYIDFYQQAQYADGRETDLTGEEANEIYGRSIIPFLQAYNSLPAISMPVGVVLTEEEAAWEQAVVVRYASRDAFLRIFILNPLAEEALEHKWAGVENTLVYATEVESETLPEVTSGPLYNFRYCEVLLVDIEDDTAEAEVYNSMGLNTCPQNDWDALRADDIARAYSADAVFLNGIRFWVLDFIQSSSGGTGEFRTETFGNIEMRLAATVELPYDGDLGEYGEGGYQVSRVSRDTVFHYNAGRQVYELQDPDGKRYMMQSFSRVSDPNLQLGDLQTLGRRLDLPPGWRFSTRVLKEKFLLRTVDGIAEVVTDDLNNTYQRVP